MGEILERRQERLARAERVGEMLSLLRALLDGRASRAEVLRWTEGLIATSRDRGSCFNHRGSAHYVFESIANIDECLGDVVTRPPLEALGLRDEGFVLRRQDIEEFVRDLAEGSEKMAPRGIAVTPSLSTSQIAEALSLRDARSWVDGLGWGVGLRFASLATGRRFTAYSPLGRQGAEGATIHTTPGEPLVEAVADLFDTLGIDLDDTLPGHPQLTASELGAWSLWRQDDNGNRAAVQRFTGLTKARRALASFEARHHKQTYWLEEAR